MTDVTLADWLLERIAEDEAAARAASPGPWEADGHAVQQVVVDDRPGYEGLGLHMHIAHTHMTTGRAQQEWANGRHIARHDPARVLAECEAKRRIVNMMHGYPPRHVEFWALHDAVQLLALPYADHPHYRDDWRP